MLEIIDTLWVRPRDLTYRLHNGEPATSLHGAAYTRYCLLQRSYLTHELGVQDKAQDGGFVWDVAQLLRGDFSRPEVVSAVEQRLKGRVGVEHCQELVFFTARLLVMMDVGRFMSEANFRRGVLWESGSLRDCVNDHFSEVPKMGCESIKFPKAFNAWGIESVGGIKNDRTQGLPEETLRTLALLFPQAEFSRALGCARAKTIWLKRLFEKYEKSNCLVDKRLTRCGNLNTSERQVQNFKFWRDRLVILKQAYDEATPSTLPQWWHDRRNGVQWYTFWVAVLVLTLTILLGLIQCIEGALQVYKAYHPST